MYKMVLVPEYYMQNTVFERRDRAHRAKFCICCFRLADLNLLAAIYSCSQPATSSVRSHFIRRENSFLVSYETPVTPEDLRAVNAANQSTLSVLDFTWR